MLWFEFFIWIGEKMHIWGENVSSQSHEIRQDACFEKIYIYWFVLFLLFLLLFLYWSFSVELYWWKSNIWSDENIFLPCACLAGISHPLLKQSRDNLSAVRNRLKWSNRRLSHFFHVRCFEMQNTIWLASIIQISILRPAYIKMLLLSAIARLTPLPCPG